MSPLEQQIEASLASLTPEERADRIAKIQEFIKDTTRIAHKIVPVVDDDEPHHALGALITVMGMISKRTAYTRDQVLVMIADAYDRNHQAAPPSPQATP